MGKTKRSPRKPQPAAVGVSGAVKGNAKRAQGKAHNSSPVGLPDRVASEITEWVCNNANHLIESVLSNYQVSSLQRWTTTTKKHEALDLPYKVLKSRIVRQFPCCLNVKNTAKEVIEKYIVNATKHLSSFKVSKSENSLVHIKCRNVRHVLFFQDELEQRHKTCGPEEGRENSHMSGQIENPELGPYISVKISMDDPLEYWKIINQASSFDRNRGSFIQALKRLGLQWKRETKIKREILATVAGIVAAFDPRFEGAGSEVKELYGDLAAGRPEFQVQLDGMMPNLVPIATQSEAVRRVIMVKDGTTKSSPRGRDPPADGLIVQNNRCHRFWNSRYLFHLNSKDKGVAINTINGLVHDVDFRYKNRWEFKLSPATVDRWERFVRKDQGIQWEKFRSLTRDMWTKFEAGD